MRLTLPLLLALITGLTQSLSAAPLDRMRGFLGPLDLALFAEALPLTMITAVDIAVLRESGLTAPDRSLAMLPGEVAAPVFDLFHLGKASRVDAAFEAGFGLGLARVEGLVSFGVKPDDGAILVLSSSEDARTLLAHLNARDDAAATPDGLLVGPELGTLDLARMGHGEDDPVRGVLGWSARIVGNEARVSLAYSATADDVAQGRKTTRDFVGTYYQAALAAIPDVQRALLAALDDVLPADARPYRLSLAAAGNAPSAVAQGPQLAPFAGLATLDWVAPTGDVGGAVALNFFLDCAGAGEAAAVIASRWTKEPLGAGTEITAEVFFGPLLAATGGALAEGGQACTMAFATAPRPAGDGTRNTVGQIILFGTRSGEMQILR